MIKAATAFLLLIFTVGAVGKPNFLFISVDDLRPDLNCYGNSMIHSPNIDSLAEKGVLFERAYVNIAVCNPSRASMMTGLYPDSVRVWDLRVHFREANPAVTTLPQHLRKHGYHALGIGKIYHNPTPDPQSWSEAIPPTKGVKSPYSEEVRKQILEAQTGLPEGHHYKDNLRGPAAMPNVNEEDIHTWDGANTELAVKALKRFSSKKQPFFLAMGFIRPHLPFTAPKKYWDLYDRSKIKLADNRFMPENGYPEGIGSNYELKHYSDMLKFPRPQDGEVDAETALRLRHGYYACISMVDNLIGKLLKTLKDEGLDKNTVIIFWSDHGWKLGEHNGWSKMTNHELDTRIPMIICDPNAKANGKRSSRLVESVDLYPTICDLAGIPLNKGPEGKSFKDLLNNPEAEFKDAVFSQYIQPYKNKQHMGYAVRTDKYRYVEWRELPSGKINFQELYDQDKDPQENVNIFSSADKDLTQKLQNRLHQWNEPKKLDRTPVVRSSANTERSNVSITNTLEAAVKVYWITQEGRRKWQTSIKPGDSWNVKSRLGHAFAIEAVDGTRHEIFYAGYPRTDIILK